MTTSLRRGLRRGPGRGERRGEMWLALAVCSLLLFLAPDVLLSCSDSMSCFSMLALMWPCLYVALWFFKQILLPVLAYARDHFMQCDPL